MLINTLVLIITNFIGPTTIIKTGSAQTTENNAVRARPLFAGNLWIIWGYKSQNLGLYFYNKPTS